MPINMTELNISGFRALQNFSVTGLGRVNLITGRNNTGKSSVLEALRILASDAKPAVISNILRYREENTSDTTEATRMDAADLLFQFASLFSGYPQPNEKFPAMKIKSSGQRSLELEMRIARMTRVRNQDGSSRLLEQQQDALLPITEDECEPALVVTSSAGTRHLPLDFFRRYPYKPLDYRSEFGEAPPMQCVYVSPYGGEKTVNLVALWDNIVLSDRENDVVLALKIIDPSISAVSMVGLEGRGLSRSAIVRSANFPHPVPLRSFGDGLNRLFGIVLSLVNAKGGLLLIDEFENGLHHTVQFDVWRVIFQLAQRLDVQVFATSHSWDAIEAFQKAAADTAEEGVLVRLSRQAEDIIPTLFKNEELAVITRDGIEVR
jgi:energy-coupling factor transporter ATP-binding protein EcfA2